MKAIINGKIILPDGICTGKALLFERHIRAIADEAPRDADVIDAGGLYVSPGLVDVHIHGYRGEDASDGSAPGLAAMAEGILENGVTAFLPTTMTVPWGELERAFAVIRAVMKESQSDGWPGAQIMGCHAEGPFINPDKKGAQAGEAILAPDAPRLLPYADILKIVTFAPEMPGGERFIRDMAARGAVALSIGHTNATFEQAMAAFSQGASRVTHTFNAMSPLTHRAPGAAGAALCADVYCELIADTFHVHRGLFPLLRRAKGDKLALITDCTRAGGLEDGAYTLGGQAIYVRGIECRLADGTIAGSVLRLNDAVRNYRDHARAPFHEAVNCASLYPARSAGLDKQKGSLEPGKDADIALIDEDCRVHGVFVRGARRR